ncbi:MAG: DALR domain-containing protein [Solitalea-like symbiont of Acarus siro]
MGAIKCSSSINRAYGNGAPACYLKIVALVEEILKKGFAYETNGSVYFDLEKYAKIHNYGILNNRHLEDLINNTRELSGQSDKKGRLDFALWIKAKPEHIMKWPSPWSVGFPGWHIECSAMARKYLGDTFDIHGGGLDLLSTHHSNEIAQSQAATNHIPARYWLHTNMLTLNGTKMSKSLNNAILPEEIFNGNHKALSGSYKPMVLRLLMLQAHYRSQLDISDTALEAANKAYNKLVATLNKLKQIPISDKSSFNVEDIKNQAYKAINDDFNTATLLAVLFDIAYKVNLVTEGQATITDPDAQELIRIFTNFTNDILGISIDNDANSMNNNLMTIIADIRYKAKNEQNWATSDYIRAQLSEIGVQLKDHKDGSSEWSFNK